MATDEGTLQALPTPPDAGSVRGDDWPRRPFPPVRGLRAPGFAVVFDRSALHAIYLHGRESPDVEVCGVLVGTVGADEQGPFVHVHDTIRGEHAANQAGQVTFTAATWDHIQRTMDRRGPEERIAGWYHTHPDFGIFLSDMDLFIHRHFFDLPWQLAFVYDPVRQKEGLFVWRSGEPVEEAFLMHENVPPSDMPQVVLKGPPRPLAAQPLERTVELGQRLAALERRLLWLSAGLVVALMVGLLWPLALVLAAIPRQPPPPTQPLAPADTRPAPPDTRPAPPDTRPGPVDTRPALPVVPPLDNFPPARPPADTSPSGSDLRVLGATTVGLCGSPLGQGALLGSAALFHRGAAPGTDNGRVKGDGREQTGAQRAEAPGRAK